MLRVVRRLKGRIYNYYAGCCNNSDTFAVVFNHKNTNFSASIEVNGVTRRSNVKNTNIPRAIEMGSAGSALPINAKSNSVITRPYTAEEEEANTGQYSLHLMRMSFQQPLHTDKIAYVQAIETPISGSSAALPTKTLNQNVAP